MISFATDFPVNTGKTSADFLNAIREWLLGSPHTSFTAEDVAGLLEAESFRVQNPREALESLRLSSTNEDAAAIRYTKADDGLEWATTIGFAREPARSWVGIRTSCESQHPSARLPAARKPVVVRTLLNNLGGGSDGLLQVQAQPVHLDNIEIDLAARCINGAAGCRLPVVYVSAPFSGQPLVHPQTLADQLAGMAHVLVEPNRPFSLRLMSEVESQNVYGGTVGIYWPDAAGSRSFFLKGSADSSAADIKRAIFEEIRIALANRRPLAKCTWASVQEAVSQKTFKALKDQGSTDLNQYIDAFDKEMASRTEKLADAEREISRLKSEVSRYQARNPMQSGLTLKTGHERDLYPDEILSVVADLLPQAVNHMTPDSRRAHILQSLAEANPSADEGGKRREALKAALRDYRAMDARTKRTIQDLGFTVTEDGKHYKLLFQGDDRYTFVLPKTGSDHRGGLNAAHDIGRLLF